MSFIRTLERKLRVIVADPGYAARVVGSTVSKVATGQRVVPGSVVVPAEVQRKRPTIGSTVGAPLALLGGAGAGTVAGVAAATLPEGRTKEFIVNHPFVSVTAAGLGVAAPAAAVAIGAHALNVANARKETVVQRVHDVAENPSSRRGSTKRKAKPRKAKRKAKKKRSKGKSKKRRRTKGR